AELTAMVRSLALELVDGKVLVDGHDVSSELRSEEVTNNVSEVSAHPAVRAALVELQQDVASDGDTIVEGRDIGSAVFPDADVKVFLTATANERALRRARQLDLPTERPAIERVARDIERRDRADSSRAASPLVRPQDAHVLDTTELAFEEVVSEIVDLIRRMR
ncbi:MAG: (d)CMP kinase, partial [Actinomycetota bacterium]|nr:(d)CMP kinase [Actinomycetota bacterium]